MTEKKIVVTIDGPAGAGKTTASRILARRLGYKYIDTGALYRGIALAAKEADVDPDRPDQLQELLDRLTLEFVFTGDELRLRVNGKDVSDRIRTPEISMAASAVSAKPIVRAFLLDVQRRMGREKGAVFEGRDMGTVVFPEAEVKFYLDAALENRALRRYKELESDKNITLDRIRADMEKRDYNDCHRELAPLKPAADAIKIDSSGLDIEGVLGVMLSHIGNVLG